MRKEFEIDEIEGSPARLRKLHVILVAIERRVRRQPDIGRGENRARRQAGQDAAPIRKLAQGRKESGPTQMHQVVEGVAAGKVHDITFQKCLRGAGPLRTTLGKGGVVRGETLEIGSTKRAIATYEAAVIVPRTILGKGQVSHSHLAGLALFRPSQGEGQQTLMNQGIATLLSPGVENDVALRTSWSGQGALRFISCCARQLPRPILKQRDEWGSAAFHRGE